MMTVKTRPFDASRIFHDAESQADLLNDALETGHAPYVAQALGVVARARGKTQIAREAGVSRESLCKSLSLDGNPELATVFAVVKALKLKLVAEAGEDGETDGLRTPC